jgi:hypothetical protein
MIKKALPAPPQPAKDKPDALNQENPKLFN